MDPQQEKDPSDAFSMRAGNAGDEFRKNTLAFSVGALAAFFISLTGEKASNLSDAEQLMLLVALVAFALATVSGLLAWLFAGRYFYEVAKEMRSLREQGMPVLSSPKGLAPTSHILMYVFQIPLVVLFGIGVIVSAVYLLHKIWLGLIVSILCGWLTMNAAGGNGDRLAVQGWPLL
jgi:hypothetical protein